MTDAAHLLEVEGLAVEFHTAQGTVHAVNGIGYHVDAGETLAILGESGSGKGVQAAAIMNLIDSPPGYVTAGCALFRGNDLFRMSSEERRRINGRAIAMIFQDTLAHLNPVYSVGWQIAETLRVHGAAAAGAARARAADRSGAAAALTAGPPRSARRRRRRAPGTRGTARAHRGRSRAARAAGGRCPCG